MRSLILLAFIGFAVWLIRRDTARRDGVSAAVWIPTLWVGILASRPLSTWVGFGGGDDTMEGSPLDRIFFLLIIAAAVVTLARRGVDWGGVLSRNWSIFLFYAYLLVSVLWAESSIVSFKRWFKDFGNIFLALVILTEVNPVQAFRAVFLRCAYVLIPLSIVLIRYFPEMGRRYNRHSGEMEATGVTFQKNSLGAMIMVCGIVLVWDWLERADSKWWRQNRLDRFLPFGILLIGAWLMHLCDSKTSAACLLLGAGVLISSRIPILKDRIGALGGYCLAGALVVFVLDSMFGIKELILASMGRDMTFTGRTDVWRVLLELKTDPLIGTGFCSFWSNAHYRSQLPDWVAFSAHNGYLEAYIDGGWIAVILLSVMLIATGLKINAQLMTGRNLGLMRFAVWIMVVVGNFSESHFARLTPLWFLFLLVALDSGIEPETNMEEGELEEQLPSDEEQAGLSPAA